jgi:hypothetical protein
MIKAYHSLFDVLLCVVEVKNQNFIEQLIGGVGLVVVDQHTSHLQRIHNSDLVAERGISTLLKY